MSLDYEGDNICIEEMPQGCVISPVGQFGVSVVISSTHDALAVIASLRKMLAIQLGEDKDGQ